MSAQPTVTCHCGNKARYSDPVGAWRCVECRCIINSLGHIRIAKCDTGLEELEALHYRCPICGSDDRNEHNDEMHAQEAQAQPDF